MMTDKTTDNLYNPEIKQQFIQSECEKHDYTRKEVTYTSVFSKCAEYERELNKDIGEFAGEEFESTYLQKYCTTLTAYSYKKVLAIVRSYRRWYRQNILHIAPAKENRTPMKKVSAAADNNRLFRTEAGFVECIKTVYGSDRYIMLAAIMILYYYGFSKEEIPEIKISDIDTYNHSVRKVTIDNNTMYELLIRASQIRECTYESCRNGIDKYQRTYKYKTSPYLIRSQYAGKGGDNDDNGPVQQRFLSNVQFYKGKVIDELGGSADKYRAYSFRISAIQRLHRFVLIERYERNLGLNGAMKLVTKGKSDQCALRIMKNDYNLWRNTAEDPK